MRNVVGEVELNDLLANRDKIAQRIRDIVSETTGSWGLEVASVELKDIILPEDMKRTMAKQAEAQREKLGVIYKELISKGEAAVCLTLKEAGIECKDIVEGFKKINKTNFKKVVETYEQQTAK